MGVDLGGPHIREKVLEVRDRWALEIAQVLIAAGANIDARDPDGMTPLSAAVHYKRQETAKGLITAWAALSGRPPEITEAGARDGQLAE